MTLRRRAWVFVRYCHEDHGNSTIASPGRANSCHPVDVRVFEGYPDRPPDSDLATHVYVEPGGDGAKTGAQLIADERQRQQDVEGWTLEHDLYHRSAGLAINAAALAVHGTDFHLDPEFEDSGRDWGLVKKHGSTRVRALVIAGALLAAEVDRELQLNADKENQMNKREAKRQAWKLVLQVLDADCSIIFAKGGGANQERLDAARDEVRAEIARRAGIETGDTR